jgi:tRNA-uridine 2-sulfurtransferase
MSTKESGKGNRVVIAMSGGVDSSVAAALLVEQGYEVIGIMLRLWQEPGNASGNRCCTPDAMALARKVAAKLGIPFYVVDAREEFRKIVVDYFIRGYTNNITPNPCLKCNRDIRWGFLYKHALSMGADFLATGHYARIHHNDKFYLLRALDKAKDQSYVLHVLNQELLSRTKFPLGEYTKDQVRDFAIQFSLPVANRKDSQDLCFIGKNDYRAFLQFHAPESQQPGPILNSLGQEIGTHNGLAFYTIGQRKGLGISGSKPFYVIEKNQQHNSLIVAPRNEMGSSELIASKVNWISGTAPVVPFHGKIKIRYKAADIWGLVTPISDTQINIKFETQLFDITPGQAAVIYQDDICLGGGIITGTTTIEKRD